MEEKMASELVPVPFHGDVIEAAKTEDGVYVPLRRLCDNLGLQSHGQAEKLRHRAWANTQMICLLDSAGREFEMLCLHLDSVPMWLATIEPSRVKEELRG